MQNMERRYRKVNEYLKEKYGGRTLKICVDGGFTCPNRDGTKGTGGCIFCSQRGSGDHLEKQSIREQVERGLKQKATRADRFIVYFQNYTNTYDTIENLKVKYEQALISDKIVCLAVATRPDCVNENVCKLLASFQDKVDVWVELGLQTVNDGIGKMIHRGYNTEDFEKSVKLLNMYHIDCVVHVMIGLPGETKEDIRKTVDVVNHQPIQGIKIHSTYVVQNTELEKMYKKGIYVPMSLEDYIKKTCFLISYLNPDIVIHKISGDAPKDLLVAPEWNLHKKWILNGIEKYLKENNLWQGKYFYL